MRKTILIAAASLATLASTQAPAQSAPARVAVGYADLDLGRAADRARLDRRIAAAVESVCGSYAVSFTYQERDIARCRAGARAGIDAQLAALQSRRDRTILVSASTR